MRRNFFVTQKRHKESWNKRNRRVGTHKRKGGDSDRSMIQKIPEASDKSSISQLRTNGCLNSKCISCDDTRRNLPFLPYINYMCISSVAQTRKETMPLSFG